MPSSKRRIDSSNGSSSLSSRSTTASSRSIASSKESASHSRFFSMGSLIGQRLPSPHLTIDLSVGKAHPEEISGLHFRNGPDQALLPVTVYEGISPAHHLERTETVQPPDPAFPKGAPIAQKMDHRRRTGPLQSLQPFPEGGDFFRRAAGCQAGHQMFQPVAPPFEPGAERLLQIPGQLIQPLFILPEPPSGMLQGREAPQPLQTFPLAQQELFQRAAETVGEHSQPVLQFVEGGSDQLGGGRRRGRPDIRRQVGDGHVRLMPHGRHHRNPRTVDAADHLFLIESPQLLQGPPPRPTINTSTSSRRFIKSRASAIAWGASSP